MRYRIVYYPPYDAYYYQTGEKFLWFWWRWRAPDNLSFNTYQTIEEVEQRIAIVEQRRLELEKRENRYGKSNVVKEM